MEMVEKAYLKPDQIKVGDQITLFDSESNPGRYEVKSVDKLSEDTYMLGTSLGGVQVSVKSNVHVQRTTEK